jgi:hypothetical protein
MRSHFSTLMPAATRIRERALQDFSATLFAER